MKGISDFGNSDKGKEENAYEDALQNTAHGLKEWIFSRIPAITWNVDESKSIELQSSTSVNPEF